MLGITAEVRSRVSRSLTYTYSTFCTALFKAIPLVNGLMTNACIAPYRKPYNIDVSKFLYVCRTTYHKNSFVVSSMTAWNLLKSNYKNVTSLSSFKRQLILNSKSKRITFNENSARATQVAFTQIRMGFSDLKDNLHVRGCVQMIANVDVELQRRMPHIISCIVVILKKYVAKCSIVLTQ